ncbi:outer membrane beta-barrel protein [Pedobacter sp. GSP4]|uniref:outer membrane beta-barrel protein n=1 Tax=Pedobacter sp. GSP4 TaxID=3453716 RepID=UPI003EF04EC0
MRICFIFLFFFVVLNCKAQFSISGKVRDDYSKALPFITVKISGTNNSTSYTQSDSLGNYYFNKLPAGNYIIAFSAVDFKNLNQQFTLKRDTVIDIQLQPSTKNLADVQVNAKKALIEKKIDWTVFNVENSIAAIGTDALELISKVPGVRVLNDQVSLVGKGGVNVMINDKPVPLAGDDLSNYLKTISSDLIVKIEVISNPPAKYDAQGNNGLINIVLKKVTAEGFKGALNGSLTQASHLTGAAGGNFGFRKNRITINTSLNLRKGSVVPFEQSNVFYPAQTWSIVNKDRNFRTVPSGSVGIDYQLAKKTWLGVAYNGGLTNFHSEENIKTNVYDRTGGLDSVLNSDANAQIRSHYHSANIYLKEVLDTAGKQLSINADWFTYSDDKDRFFNNTSFFPQGAIIPNSFAEYLSTSRQGIDLYTLTADLDLPYKSFKVSLGTKLSLIRNQSDLAFYKIRNGAYEIDPKQTNLFNYQENTQALYANFNKSLKSWDFQAGLRGEYTEIEGLAINAQNTNSYFRLFPTLYITYRANNESTFSIHYGRRINRPAYRKLNPFRWYSNQYAYTEGNPFLQPSYNHNIEVSHVYNSIFTTSLSFGNTVNGFSDVNFIDTETHIQVAKPVNFIRSYHYQISNAFVFNRLTWWSSTNELDVYYNVSNSSITETLNKLNGFGAYFSTLNQFVFNKPKTILGEVSFWYQFPAIDGLNKNKNQYNLDLGIKALLLNKKIQLALTAGDVLKTNKYRFNSLINNIRQDYNNYYDSQQLRITFRYHFGNEKIKQQDSKPGNEEERKRNN